MISAPRDLPGVIDIVRARFLTNSFSKVKCWVVTPDDESVRNTISAVTFEGFNRPVAKYK